MQEKMALDNAEIKEPINSSSDQNLLGLAQTAKIIGDEYMRQGDTERARRAFLAATDFTCGIVQGTEKNCIEISRYLMLAAETYPESADQRILILTANRLYAHDIDVRDLHKYLDYLIDSSSGIDEKLFSDVLLPVLNFIYSNHPNFQNPYLHKLLNGFLTYFTHSQNNRKLFTLLAVICILMNDYHDTITTLEHDILIKQEEIEHLRRGLTNRSSLVKQQKELEERMDNQQMIIKEQRKIIAQLQRELEINKPAIAAEEIEEEIEEVIAQLQPESEINKPAIATKMSTLELHQLVNSFHTYRTHSQDDPQLLKQLSSNCAEILKNHDRTKSLEHELIELQERIKRIIEDLTKRKIIDLLYELRKEEKIVKDRKLFIKEQQEEITEIEQLLQESKVNKTVVAASEQLLEVTERLPLPRAASEQPLEITEQLPLLRATRLPRAERAASEPPSSSFKRKEREPSPSFFGLRALEKKEATPDEPQLKRMRIRDDRTPTPFSLPAPLSL